MRPQPRDPSLFVFRHLFASVTDEMGVALRQSAVSPNIKERLDYSCALLDATGRLVAHAAFIPVHLGSASSTVPAVLEVLDPGPGDIVLLNDPFHGGTHLNDVTVLMPLFDGEERCGFLLNRAHHADIGGAEPGSMTGATDLREEGYRIEPTYLHRAGKDRPEVWRGLLDAVRDPEATRGDLMAQLAALHRGERRFRDLLRRYQADTLKQAMQGLFEHGVAFMRRSLQDWPRQEVVVEDRLDGPGTPLLRLRMKVESERLVLDFEGTSAQVPGSWNTHRAVTTSAVFYMLQALGGGRLPETSGTLEVVDLRLPKDSLVGASYPAGVALGNVETSQRIVDLLLAGLRQLMPGRFPAASQGTMNNLLFGGEHADGSPFCYYETLGGGAGGGPAGPGASAVQSHMTNTRNTPVEVLEAELPLRVRRLALRRGSGGAGQAPGGEGLVKEIQFLRPVRLSVAATRRRTGAAPAGEAEAGKPGRQALVEEGGERELAGAEAVDLPAASILRIATPGGGGYTPPDQSLV